MWVLPQHLELLTLSKFVLTIIQVYFLSIVYAHNIPHQPSVLSQPLLKIRDSFIDVTCGKLSHNFIPTFNVLSVSNKAFKKFRALLLQVYRQEIQIRTVKRVIKGILRGYSLHALCMLVTLPCNLPCKNVCDGRCALSWCSRSQYGLIQHHWLIQETTTSTFRFCLASLFFGKSFQVRTDARRSPHKETLGDCWC